MRAGKRPENTSLREGGLSLVINLSLPSSEAERRGNNRRLDPLSGVIYNLEDNLPPLEEKGLADRLQIIEDSHSTAD